MQIPILTKIFLLEILACGTYITQNYAPKVFVI